MSLVRVTTESRRKAHLAKPEDLSTDRHAPRIPGRRGRTLCGFYGFDQERYDAMLRQRGHWKSLDVADLPVCRQCEKSAAAWYRPEVNR